MMSQGHVLKRPPGYHLHVPVGLIGSPWVWWCPHRAAGLAIPQHGSPCSEQYVRCATGVTWDKDEHQSSFNGKEKPELWGWVGMVGL